MARFRVVAIALTLPIMAGAAAAFAGVPVRLPGWRLGARRAGPPACWKDGNEREVLSATEEWLDDFVIRLGLCPWAQLTRGLAPTGTPRTRIVTLPGGIDCIDSHVSAVVAEATTLRRSPDGSSSFFTTLLVFPDGAFAGRPPADCGEFPRLVRHVQDRLNSEPVPDRVDLLAFHRFRTDEGPGTRRDVEDAAHFSVRSPSRPPYVPQPA